jgi:hypothetical protein
MGNQEVCPFRRHEHFTLKGTIEGRLPSNCLQCLDKMRLTTQESLPVSIIEGEDLTVHNGPDFPGLLP